MIKEIDFTGYLEKDLRKTFTFYNDDGSNYDFSDTDQVIFKLYKDVSTPLDIIGSFNVADSTVTFILLATTHTSELGAWEYIIEETKTSTIISRIGYGNFTVQEYLPFSTNIKAWLTSELPYNLTLIEDYVNQRLIYWRLMLQSAFGISDENLSIESEWPTLVNSLLAKLVVHDALELAAKGSFIQFLGGDYTDSTTGGGGGVKSVETGPTKVEYYDAASSAKNAFASSPGSISMFESLQESLCGLANFLKVKLPMCKGVKVVISPKYYKNPNWAYPTVTDETPSQG